MSTVGWLYISALKGTDLKIKGITSAPAIRFMLDYIKKTTKPDKKNKTNPTFTEVFEFEILDHHNSIKVELIGKSMSDEHVFGRSEVNLTEVKQKRKAEYWVPIMHPTKKKENGKVLVKMEYISDREKRINDGEVEETPAYRPPPRQQRPPSSYPQGPPRPQYAQQVPPQGYPQYPPHPRSQPNSPQRSPIHYPQPNYPPPGQYPQDPYARPADPYARPPQDPYARPPPQDYYARAPMYARPPSDLYARPPQDPYARPVDPYARPLHDPYARPPPQNYAQQPPAQYYYPPDQRMAYRGPPQGPPSGSGSFGQHAPPRTANKQRQQPPQEIHRQTRPTPRPRPPPQSQRPHGPPDFQQRGAGGKYYTPPEDDDSSRNNSQESPLPRPSYTPGPYRPRPNH